MDEETIKQLTDFAIDVARFVSCLAIAVMLVGLFGMVATCSKKFNEDTHAEQLYK